VAADSPDRLVVINPRDGHEEVTACTHCLDRASKVTQLETELAPVIQRRAFSEALSMLKSARDALGPQYKVKMDKIEANLLLASEDVRAEDLKRLIHNGTPSGLKWLNAGHNEPANGQVLVNEELEEVKEKLEEVNEELEEAKDDRKVCAAQLRRAREECRIEAKACRESKQLCNELNEESRSYKEDVDALKRSCEMYKESMEDDRQALWGLNTLNQKLLDGIVSADKWLGKDNRDAFKMMLVRGGAPEDVIDEAL